MDQSVIKVLSSPFGDDNNLPWEYTETQFINWVSEVFLESYKRDIIYPSISEAIEIVESNKYKMIRKLILS